MLKRAARWAGRRLPQGLKRELRSTLGVPSQEGTLRRMREHGFCPRWIVDVGAFVGDWTRMVTGVFPDAKVLMVEPQAECRHSLDELADQNPRISVAQTLLGDEVKDVVEFFGDGTIGSVLRETGSNSPSRASYPMTTLDHLTSDSCFSRAELIKIDVQGYALNVVKGGGRLVGAAEAVLIEIDLIDIYEKTSSFREMVDVLDDMHLVLFDICELIRRPRDNALWQVDAMFVRNSSALLSSKSWA